MATMHFEAEPYPLAFEHESTALLMIDMQRDFVEPGGFGEMLGTTSRCCAPRSNLANACWKPPGRPGSR
jgi:nicotinamidase-related amidase